MVKKHRNNIGQDNSINSNYNNSGSNKRKGVYFEAGRRKRKRYLMIVVPIVTAVIGVIVVSSSIYSSEIDQYGVLGSAHEHAAFMIQLDNKTIDFGQDKYQVKSRLIHVEGGDGFTIHRHTDKVPFGEFLRSVNMDIKDQCFISADEVGQQQQQQQYCSNGQKELRVFLNKNELENPASIMDYVAKDNDRILITYGNETANEINRELAVLSQMPIKEIINADTSSSSSSSSLSRAPDFNLKTIDGRQISLESFSGKPAILWFMAAWCPTCVNQAEAIKQVKSDYGDKIDVLAVDLWVPQNIGGQNTPGLNAETESDLEDFLTRHGSTEWNAALDTDTMTINYGITQVDSTVVIDGEGNIVLKYLGPSGYQPMKDAIERALA